MGMTREQAEAEIQRLMASGSTTQKAIDDLTEAVRQLQSATAAPTVDPVADGKSSRAYIPVAGERGKHIQAGVRMVADRSAPVTRYGLLDDPAPATQWQRELQSLVQQRSIVRAARGDSPITDGMIAEHLKNAPAVVTRIHADISTVGAELVPDLIVPELERAMILAMPSRIAGRFPVVQMSGKEYRPPFMSSGLRPYLKGGPASASDNSPAQYTASNLAIAQRSISAIGLAVRGVLDDDLAEDSIIDMQTEIQSALVDALLDGLDDAIINGDSTATHQDTIASWDIRGRWGSSGLGGSTDHRRGFIGLRAGAADVASSGGITDGGSVQTFAGLMTAKGRMGVNAGALGDTIVLVSPEYALKIGQFTQLVTADVLGAQAFNVSGAVGLVGGMPVYITPFLSADLNASGIYDNSTKTKTGMILVNAKRYKVYQRKAGMVELARDVTRGVTDLVATWRGNFATLDSNAASATSVQWVYNLTP